MREQGRTAGGESRERRERAPCEDEDLDSVEARRLAPLPKGKPRHRLLESSETSLRLGQRRFAAGRLACGFRMASGKIETGGAQIGK